MERHNLACIIVDGNVDLLDHLRFYTNIERSFEDDFAQLMARLRIECSDSQEWRLGVPDAHEFPDI